MKKLSVAVLSVMLVLLASVSFVYAAGELSGTVVETMNSGGYTYVQIENNGEKVWVAIPQVNNVEVGQERTFSPGMLMRNFTSKTLGRTFDAIYFSNGLIE